MDFKALWAVLRVLLWPLLALVLVYLRHQILSHMRQNRISDPDANRAALYLYGQLLRLAPWSGDPPQALTALAEKARFSTHTLTGEELKALKAGLKTAQAAALEGKSTLHRLVLRYLRCLC